MNTLPKDVLLDIAALIAAYMRSQRIWPCASKTSSHTRYTHPGHAIRRGGLQDHWDPLEDIKVKLAQLAYVRLV